MKAELKKKISLEEKSSKTNQVDERHVVKEGFYWYIHSYRLRIVGPQKNIFKKKKKKSHNIARWDGQDDDELSHSKLVNRILDQTTVPWSVCQ